jgi:hypothetical protein
MMTHKFRTRGNAIASCVLVPIVCISIVACEAPSAGTTLQAVSVSSVRPVSSSGAVDECLPVKVAVLADKTASSTENHIEAVAMSHVEALVRLVNKCGGAIALGLITDRSDRPLQRYSIEPPPTRPMAPPDNIPPFEFSERRAHYEDALNRYQQAEASRLEEKAPTRDQFFRAVRSLLERPATAQRTDMAGAVARADVFLSEREVNVQTNGRRVLVIVSDTLDNVHRSLPVLEAGATIVVATAGTVSRLIADLDPVRFESVQAAVDFTVASAGAPAVVK